MEHDWLQILWQGLGWPLARLFFMTVGLLVANFIEALNWTHVVARLAAPLSRIGNLSDISGASFFMFFFGSFRQDHAGRGLRSGQAQQAGTGVGQSF